MSLTLIDTSAWTRALRRNGNPVIRGRVDHLIAVGEAAWCDPVRLELLNGVRGIVEREKLEQLGQLLPLLPITSAVWQVAGDTALRARTQGVNVPAMDLVIFACAKEHGVALEHADQHYPLLAALK